MSQIFKVKVEVELYFYGSEPPDDCELAEAVKGEIELGNHSLHAFNISSVDEVGDEEWLSACPYGEEGDRKTLSEWLAS